MEAMEALPDSRTSSRYAVDLSAQLGIDTIDVACRIANLSLGGVFVRGPALAIGKRVTLAFRAPPYVGAFCADCTARWSNRYGSGLQFDDLRPVDVRALAELIRSLLQVTQPASLSTRRDPKSAGGSGSGSPP
jgi:PilZ domain-containing protein